MAKSVDELMKEAEELQKKVAPDLYGEGDDKGTSDEETETQDEEAPAPDKDEKTPEEETEEEKAARLEAEEAEKKAAEDKIPDAKDEEISTLKNEIADLKDQLSKVKATAGRVSQTAEANDRLKERIAGLEQEILTLKEAKKVPDKADNDDVLAEMIDEYGEDSLAVKSYKRQQAREDEIKGEMKSIRQEISTVKETSIKSNQRGFIEILQDEVPDWESIKDNPDFAKYLDDNLLMPALQDAVKKLDTVTTAKIYKNFKKTSTPEKTPDTPPKKDKGKLTAPGSSSKADSNKEQIPVYTREEIDKMTKDMSKLRDQGRDKEANKIKAKIDAFTDSLGSFR